jgi:aconitate hydratase
MASGKATELNDSFKAHQTLDVQGKTFHYFSLPKAAANGLGDISRLPFSMKVLLENLLRHEDGVIVTKADIQAVATWLKTKTSTHEVAYHPARVLMQDFTGVPAVVDLAAMREAMQKLGGDPKKINPLSPVDLVIDHSVMVDKFATKEAFQENVDIEFERNGERYAFLRWAQKAFNNFSVVPPGTGICHQVNLEYLARVVFKDEINGENWAYPDTLVGTDSHTTMVNGLAVLGWGVGGIEAEAAMLKQPLSMVIPEVIGFKLTGKMAEGMTATDLVLTVTEMLRKKGAVGKFVEFYGDGLANLSLADRATIANMAPEYGATCGFFPIDGETIRYLRFTGRDDTQIALVEAYAKAQGMWRDASSPEPHFTDVMHLDTSSVVPSLAGPRRPQDRIQLNNVASQFKKELTTGFKIDPKEVDKKSPVADSDFSLEHGSVVIAAITSCTNTSNPSVMLAAGLLAQNAINKGLTVKPWVKTSLAPGSQVVTDYLEAAGLQKPLDQLGFNLVGYGCTTCIGNSGPLPDTIAAAVHAKDLVCASVLSGNRNFEGRIGPDIKANFLASPPLVVAYAIAGSMNVDITKDALGTGKDGRPVYLKDIWPSNKDISSALEKSLTPAMFRKRYSDVFLGTKQWQNVKAEGSLTFNWDEKSTYVRNPPYFEGLSKIPAARTDIKDARALAILGDSTTTDHISPAGSIKEDSPAGKYLKSKGVGKVDFNSYGARRGNHEVMMRGTFANIRIRNEMMPGIEGGFTRLMPVDKQMSIYDAAMEYQKANVPLVIIAGKEYGTGSSRDWAAKGTFLLGVRAVVAESFERIHRSNLIGMGVLPLEFSGGQTRVTLKLDGSETFDIAGLSNLTPRGQLECKINRKDGRSEMIKVRCRIDTADEYEYFKNGGILQYVIRKLL